MEYPGAAKKKTRTKTETDKNLNLKTEMWRNRPKRIQNVYHKMPSTKVVSDKLPKVMGWGSIVTLFLIC